MNGTPRHVARTNGKSSVPPGLLPRTSLKGVASATPAVQPKQTPYKVRVASEAACGLGKRCARK